MPDTDTIAIGGGDRHKDRVSAEQEFLKRLEQAADAYAMNNRLSNEAVAEKVINFFDRYRMRNSGPDSPAA